MLERNENIVVGVNAFQVEEKMELVRLIVDPTIESDQHARLTDLRSHRDTGKVSELLAILENSALGDENLMPILIECVENDITLGEICGVLRSAWGEYQPPVWL
jgi:methylmalonyl-CoA mutase N-terminal domain/subunit